MKNDHYKLENKLKNSNSQRPQTEIKSNNKQSNNIVPKKNNLHSSVNVIQNRNNLNINNLGKNQTKNKKINKAKNAVKFSVNCNHFYNDYKTNIKEHPEKPYTPKLKNQNDYFEYFNWNNNYINNRNEKNNNIDSNNCYKRSKSSHKPINQINQKNLLVKLAPHKSNEGFKKTPSFINENKKQNLKKSIIHNNDINNLTPNKKISTQNKPNINKNQRDIKEIKRSINNNSQNLMHEINNVKIKNNNNDDKNLINNNNLNKSINQKSQPFISYGKSEHPNKEYREQMEDFSNFKILTIKNMNFSYFSIFDGHSGIEVPMFLRDNYHNYLKNELESKVFTNNLESNNQIIISSIKNSFEKIDHDIINNNKFKNNNGSTGTIILIYRDINRPLIKTLICANIGDSKGFIINKNSIRQITKDHNCDNANEVKRIKSSGGLIFQGRVYGSLMLTRSFGDKEYKQCGVMASPDFFCEIINDDDLYAIIASDGVWDVVSRDQLFQLSKKNMSSVDFAKKIIITAMEGGTRDNVSCFVIKLNT